MSLMQLLTVGQSFKETKDGPSNYKLHKNALPKFAPVKRPVSLAPPRTVVTPRPAAMEPLFAAANEVAMAAQALSEEAEVGVCVGGRADGNVRPAGFAQPALPLFEQEAPAAAPAPVAPPQSRTITPFSPASDQRPAVPETALVSRKPPPPEAARSWWRFFFRRKRRNAFNRPVQTEWSLDRVKVVRNDLSDADIEVVPIEHRSPAPEPKVEKAIAGKGWSRLAARLFRANRASFLK